MYLVYDPYPCEISSNRRCLVFETHSIKFSKSLLKSTIASGSAVLNLGLAAVLAVAEAFVALMTPSVRERYLVRMYWTGRREALDRKAMDRKALDREPSTGRLPKRKFSTGRL